MRDSAAKINLAIHERIARYGVFGQLVAAMVARKILKDHYQAAAEIADRCEASEIIVRVSGARPIEHYIGARAERALARPYGVDCRLSLRGRHLHYRFASPTDASYFFAVLASEPWVEETRWEANTRLKEAFKGWGEGTAASLAAGGAALALWWLTSSLTRLMKGKA